jgi:protocatechuate 3,4-dioxygenase beta subunit
MPVPYENRPPHLHFKVWIGGAVVLTTQAYLEGQTREGGAFGWLWSLLSSTEGLTMRPSADASGAMSARFEIVLG